MLESRDVDPPSIFSDPDPADFLNADSDPADFLIADPDSALKNV